MGKIGSKKEIISLRLERSVDPEFKIDMLGVLTRTKRMVAFDTGIEVTLILVNDDLENDLDYSDGDKKDLKGLIDNFFFKDVDACAKVKDLVETTTVGDLSTRIYNNYIPEGRKK